MKSYCSKALVKFCNFLQEIVIDKDRSHIYLCDSKFKVRSCFTLHLPSLHPFSKTHCWPILLLSFFFFKCHPSLHFTPSLLAPYPGEGSAVRIRRLQKFLSSASSGTTRSSRMSRFTRSRHLPLGLPLGRLPGISMSITCLRLLSCSF